MTAYQRRHQPTEFADHVAATPYAPIVRSQFFVGARKAPYSFNRGEQTYRLGTINIRVLLKQRVDTVAENPFQLWMNHLVNIPGSEILPRLPWPIHRFSSGEASRRTIDKPPERLPKSCARFPERMDKMLPNFSAIMFLIASKPRKQAKV